MPLPDDFLSMLPTDALWAKCTGTDQWGNETWAVPAPIKCFVSSQTISFGNEDGQGKQEKRKVITAEIITDAIGAELRDKVIVAGQTFYVTALDTPKDEAGIDLMHTLTASSSEKG